MTDTDRDTEALRQVEVVPAKPPRTRSLFVVVPVMLWARVRFEVRAEVGRMKVGYGHWNAHSKGRYLRAAQLYFDGLASAPSYKDREVTLEYVLELLPLYLSNPERDPSFSPRNLRDGLFVIVPTIPQHQPLAFACIGLLSHLLGEHDRASGELERAELLAHEAKYSFSKASLVAITLTLPGIPPQGRGDAKLFAAMAEFMAKSFSASARPQAPAS